MGLFTPKKTESQRIDEALGESSARSSLQLSELLQGLLTSTRDTGMDFGLARKGELSGDLKAKLNKQFLRNQAGNKASYRAREAEAGRSGAESFDTDKAINRSFQDLRSRRNVALATDKASRQRSDLSNVFGKLLLGGQTNLINAGSGAYQDPQNLNFAQRFGKGAGEVFSAFGF